MIRRDVRQAIELLTEQGYQVIGQRERMQGWLAFAPGEEITKIFGYTPTANAERLRICLPIGDTAGSTKAEVRKRFTYGADQPGGSFHDTWKKMAAAGAIQEVESSPGRYVYHPPGL